MPADFNGLMQLRDIHLPPPVPAWPLSTAWIIAFCFLVILLGFSGVHAYRRYRWGLARREGLRLLMAYEKEYQQGANIQFLSAQISQLLRRVALVYFPRIEIASLQGEAWLNFLNKTAKGVDFNEVSEILLVLPYQANTASSLKLDRVFCHAKAWIKQRSKPCLS